MQYVGMPDSWADFYYKGFESIIRKYHLNISQEVIEKSVQMLKDFNPRISGREIEYSAEYIFTKVLEPWHIDIAIQSCIEIFWSGLQLKAEIYPETTNFCCGISETELQRITNDCRKIHHSNHRIDFYWG